MGVNVRVRRGALVLCVVAALLAAFGWVVSGGRTSLPGSGGDACAVDPAARDLRLLVRHPRNPQRWAEGRAAGLYVSSRSDRAMAAPLDGMAFDTTSTVYIFLWLEGSAGPALRVQFLLDGQPLGAATVASAGAPVDLMGPADAQGAHALPFLTQSLAARLRRSPHLGCHELRALVLAGDEPTGLAYAARFTLVARAPRAWLFTTVSVDFDLPMLPFFLAHYRDQGVRAANMVVVLHSARAEPDPSDRAWAGATALLRAHSVVPYYARGVFETFRKFELQESLARRLVLQQDWVLHADVDELQAYPGGVVRFLDLASAAGITAIVGQMADRVSRSGHLLPVPSPDRGVAGLMAAFPLHCEVTRSVAGAFVSKVAAHRGSLVAEEGGYHKLLAAPDGQIAVNVDPIIVHHFKWTANVTAKLSRRSADFERLGLRWWLQSKRLLTSLERAGGRVCVECPPLNCRDAASTLATQPGAFPRRHAPVALAAAAADTHRFTVIMMAFSADRRANQQAIMQHFTRMPGVAEFILVWNSAEVPPPPVPPPPPGAAGRGAPVRVLVQRRNSLNNRWHPGLGVRTAAVLMVDDDMLLPPYAVESLHARWLHDPDVLVGMAGRNFLGTTYLYPKDCCRAYERAPALAASMDEFCDTFRMVLPKGMFFHSDYMRLYFDDRYEQVRRFVDEQDAHCDDIALNFIVANATRKPQVMLEEEVLDYPESTAGLYEGSSRQAKQRRNELRSQCLAWLTAFFGGWQPPAFQIEAGGYHARRASGRPHARVLARRRYSQPYLELKECMAASGAKPG